MPTPEVMPEVAGNTRNGEYLRCLYYNPQNECVQAAAVRVVPVRVNLPTIITLPQLKVSMKPIVLHLYTLPITFFFEIYTNSLLIRFRFRIQSGKTKGQPIDSQRPIICDISKRRKLKSQPNL